MTSRTLLLAVGCLSLSACATKEGGDAEVGESQIVESTKLDAPWIAQKPELPRGCEVTSLTMLFRYAGVTVDKMTLAREVEKVPYDQGGFRGNPNDGFVGDMYTFAKPGYGVYHAPVARLAETYMPGRIVDLTGGSFDDILQQQVATKHPVWIVINATWKKLAASQFETWHTSSGDIKITWHEHSVLVTGFDAASVYINDPLDSNKNKKLDRQAFREAWEQMGRQAITFTGEPIVPISGSSGTCAVKSDSKLYCSNKVSPVYTGTSATSAVVDQLRSTQSWFSCWTTGDVQPNGNTTWYKTQGDDSKNWGFVPGSSLDTKRTFDVDPTAYGLPRCG
jgi:uncharacterized protein YvpB